MTDGENKGIGSSLPTGHEKDLHRIRETLPVEQVGNEVLWVNPNINAPLKLKEGEESPLGVFLSPTDGKNIEVFDRHKRSALAGRVIFCDQNGNTYRDIGVKGVGYINFDAQRRPSQANLERYKKQKLDMALGLEILTDAEHDRDIGEVFVKAGIRCDRTIAIIKFVEYIDKDAHRHAIDELREAGILLKDETPVASVRAFGVNARVNEGGDLKKLNYAYQDARQMVAQELGKPPEEFGWHKYAQWFAETLGKNIGRMLKLGYTHGNLLPADSAPYNVTLDCRIVDKDTVKHYDDAIPEIQIDFDKISAHVIINTLCQQLNTITDMKEGEFEYWSLYKVFNDAYDEELKASRGDLHT
ncbi:hypothetical protein A3J36_01585 [Candidatus Uhrbacteria bacterium RIFCSPLOWO2_02_FULL_54_37]|nr:MAG: hypothetical protein A3J36_01585 [Candidatus Uhrbacteria bacterium RIFCSPLOWO2_02_FULL_54_37]